MQHTDTELLKLAIKRSGVKMCYLAGKLNVSYPIFSALVKGQKQFTESQIETLCEEIKLYDPAMRTAIFFASHGASHEPS